MEAVLTSAKDIYKKNQVDYVKKKILDLPEEFYVPSFSEWAAENRYIPPGVSDFYGQFDPASVPHLMEPLNRLHPDDPCSHVSMMKSVQSANTTSIAENAIGVYIRYKLGSILFLTSTKGIGSIRGSANIDTMIDNSGLADYVKPMSNRTGRKTKDTSLYKEFSGGIKLLISSYNSIGDLKSNTFHLIIKDEWDEAGAELKDQGDVAGIIEGRTKGVRNFKILSISTPSRMETSRIYKDFMEGDQREYFVPCPICGEKQILELKSKGSDYGLTFTREKDDRGNKVLIPEAVRYICKFCKKEFMESKKQWMLENGVWIPQATPIDRKKHSYHSSGLIAPEYALSWTRICQDFINSNFGDDLLKFKDFTINDLGNPWAAVKKTSEWETLKSRALDYSLGEDPGGEKRSIDDYEIWTGPLCLFGGVDVQGDRLEMCITGFGLNGRKWIIDYQIFYGETSDINAQCWKNLESFVYEASYTLAGKPARILQVAIDCGYDPRQGKRGKDYAGKASIVYDFVADRQDFFIAVMGSSDDKAIGIIKESRVNDSTTGLTKRYMVSSSLLKDMIFGVIEKNDGHNSIYVPKYKEIEGKKRHMPDEFYKQFLSERYQEDPKSPGKYLWKKIRARNEVLDTFIYSIAAAEYAGVLRWTIEVWENWYQDLIRS